MPYVSPDTLLSGFQQGIDVLYKEAIKQPLDSYQQPSSIACFFGAKDLKIRLPQMVF